MVGQSEREELLVELVKRELLDAHHALYRGLE